MFSYPLNLSFKLLAFSPQVGVTDAGGATVLYVRQKALALREDVRVYRDADQQELVYRIKANQILDFSASYAITTADGEPLGAVRRQGMRSLWKATYQVADAAGAEVGLIHEADPIVKLLDGLVEMIPVVGMFGGYFFNPSYLVELRGQPVMTLRKERALFEGRFTLDKQADLAERDEALLVAGVLMMLLLERSRG
jgi:hypothetical protein